MTAFLDGALASERPPGTTHHLLDMGCGNGHHAVHAMVAHNATVAGLDSSRELLDLASLRARQNDAGHLFTPVMGELDEIPLGGGSVGAIICIAALHHLPKAAERAESLREMRRVLAPGGRALVSVWSLDAPRFRGARERQEKEGPDLEGGGVGDTLVPWTRQEDGEVFLRYYHLYSEKELEGEVRGALGPVAMECWSSGDNHFCRFEKVG